MLAAGLTGGRGLARWRELFLFVLLAVCFDAKYLWSWCHLHRVLRFGDFLGVWSYGRLAARGDLHTLYDVGALTAYQHALFPMLPGALPFFYPPTMLLLLAPLGLMGPVAAWMLWTAFGLAALLFAILPDRRRPGRAILLLLLPATVVSAAFGQTGLITGALLLGGLRLAPSRPVLGGVLLGLLTIKPQMGVLVPVALVASEQWRAIAAAIVTAAALAVVGGLTFGFGSWLAWLHALPSAADQWHTDAGTLLRFSPTLTASLAASHAPWPIIRLAQAACALLASCLVWRSCRADLHGAAIPLVCAASLLATPHGFIYDMPALCGALLLFVDRDRATALQQLAALAAQMVPIVALAIRLPFVSPALLAVLVLSLSAPPCRSTPSRARLGSAGA